MSIGEDETTARCRSWKRPSRFRARRVEASCSVATRMDRGRAVRAGECGQSGTVRSIGVARDCATRVAQCGAGRTSRARMVGHARERVERALVLAAGATGVRERPRLGAGRRRINRVQGSVRTRPGKSCP